jgi:hypothetical protein
MSTDTLISVIESHRDQVTQALAEIVQGGQGETRGRLYSRFVQALQHWSGTPR